MNAEGRPPPPAPAAGRRLSIALVASARHPIREPFAGGLEAHTHGLATALRRRGHSVRVFASDHSDPGLGYEPVCEPERALGLSDAARADASMPPERFMVEHHAYLSLMLRLARERIDLVHNNSLHYLPVAMASALPCPVLTTLHTPPTPWLESALANSGGAANASFAAVSRRTADQWSHLVACAVIHNGIDVSRWTPRSGPRHERVVWTGRLVPEKGPHLAIEAARRARLPIVLAGPVSDPDYFEKRVAPALGDGVRYAGHLRGAELRELVATSCVAAATPCWEEPFGLVIAEALASGTPVASWRIGAVAEVVTPDCARLAPYGDIDGLATAMREAAAIDPAECRRRAVRAFSIERMVDAYEGLYRGLLTRAGGGPATSPEARQMLA